MMSSCYIGPETSLGNLSTPPLTKSSLQSLSTVLYIILTALETFLPII